MFKKTEKRKIYWLLDMYLSGKIDARTFCNEYYYCFDVELDGKTLTELEAKTFSDLGKVSSKFNNNQEDLENSPGLYFSEEQLKEKILETKEKLKEQNPV